MRSVPENFRRAALALALGTAAFVADAAPAPTPSPDPTPAAAAHAFLERLADEVGPRLTGSPGNAAALDRLEAELRAVGLAPERQPFTAPGWIRGDDEVEVLAPFARRLRVAALGFSQAHPSLTGELVDIGLGRPGDYPAGELRGRVGLLASGSPLPASDYVGAAAARGLAAILFINREGGGQLLARTGSPAGQPLPLPVYSIAQEEGRWLGRLVARGVPVRLRVETRSRCVPVATANLRVVLPGRAPSRVIVGAHLDSWDLGQGALDNGIGVAQLLALARALVGVPRHHAVELIWFNGEEQGLQGSRHAAALLGATPVVAMLNLDMIGVPVAVNALGDDALVPFLERWNAARPAGRQLPKGVENTNWMGSDHTPYQLAGVRALTFNAPLPREAVRHYHDLADTVDKVTPQLLEESSAVILDLVHALADEARLDPARRPAAETDALFTRFGLDARLRAFGLK
jgi:hypothetical protein